MGSQSIGEFITSSTVMGSVRCAYSFRPALSRALAAIIGPMCGGAPVFVMYARQYGAKNPPAPATSGGVNGIDGESAHMALPSDCFSKATVNTRSYRPDCTCVAAVIAVDAPTDPAVCTRI